jgi:hypothetical protein
MSLRYPSLFGCLSALLVWLGFGCSTDAQAQQLYGLKAGVTYYQARQPNLTPRPRPGLEVAFTTRLPISRKLGIWIAPEVGYLMGHNKFDVPPEFISTLSGWPIGSIGELTTLSHNLQIGGLGLISIGQNDAGILIGPVAMFNLGHSFFLNYPVGPNPTDVIQERFGGQMPGHPAMYWLLHTGAEIRVMRQRFDDFHLYGNLLFQISDTPMELNPWLPVGAFIGARMYLRPVGKGS